MESIKINITKAEWDLRAKTKFLRVDELVMVNPSEDEVIAEQDEAHAENEKIITINITVNESNGPKQPHPAPFHFVRMTDGEEPWTHVHATDRSETSVNYPITKISLA
tara:strand:+ start:1397 stop:1720 length:324 start_codon:yes stop_codon:yes gene_type:complete